MPIVLAVLDFCHSHSIPETQFPLDYQVEMLDLLIQHKVRPLLPLEKYKIIKEGILLHIAHNLLVKVLYHHPLYDIFA